MSNRVRELMIDYGHTYGSAVELLADQADALYDRMKEDGYRNPLVAPYFCVHCHWSENAHPREGCPGFTPGDPEKVREQNRSRGFPS